MVPAWSGNSCFDGTYRFIKLFTKILVGALLEPVEPLLRLTSLRQIFNIASHQRSGTLSPCFETPYWSDKVILIPRLSLTNFPLARPSSILYNPFISQHRHSSPEDGDSMFLRNIGIYLQSSRRHNPEQHRSAVVLQFTFSWVWPDI
jgi:hypothetical protein